MPRLPRIGLLASLGLAALACSADPAPQRAAQSAPRPPAATRPASGATPSISSVQREAVLPWPTFAEMHAFHTESFVKNVGFGLSRMKRPEDSDFLRHVMVGNDQYGVRNVQLVGLLNAPTPRVYVMPGTPTQRGVQRARTRELTPFESAALDRLWAGEPFVIAEETSQLRPALASRFRPAMAALPAQKSCLECHNVQADSLMGAFVYELWPIKPSPPPASAP
ncbi:MAG: hypothetical protein NTW19_01565 [Planctomycetota bacterium]|nr:hypothetical protein [Planctomycetota bacterium]